MIRALVIGVLLLATVGAAQIPVLEPALQGSGASRGEAIRALAGSLGVQLPQGEPVKCGLPVLSAFRANRGKGGERAAAAVQLLAPRSERQTSILRSGWRIHFDTTGFHEPALLDGGGVRVAATARAFAESVGTALSRVAAVECSGLGYLPPLADGVLGGGPEPDIYIEEMGYTYGMTYPDLEGNAGSRSSAFVTIDNDFKFVSPSANRGIPGMQVTVAHEFHHVIQLSRYGYWPDDIFYYEMTSTWLEDVVYPAVNDYWNYLLWRFSHLQTPEVSFTSNDVICYSRAIWCHFVAKRYGTDIIRRSWEEIASRRPLEAIDAALRHGGSSFPAAMSEWARWNYFTAFRSDSLRFYPEGAAYPPVMQVMRQFVPPVLTLQGSLPPLASRYLGTVIPRAGGGADTLTIAVVRIDPASADAGGTANYTFTLRETKEDGSYRATGTSLFASYSITSPSEWGIWYLSQSGEIQPIAMAALAEGTPYPNPFRLDGRSVLSIPIDAATAVTGDLTILDAAMSRVYGSGLIHPTGGIRQTFTWDGRADRGGTVASGIYLYVLNLSDGRRMMGKFAVLRP